MTTNIRLLVFIPTYRRPKALKRQLADLESLRLVNPGADIDILVSHNESADAMTQIKFEGHARHRFNPTNLGADINIALAYTACDGYDFLWILSDDDHLRSAPESIVLPLDEEFDLMVLDTSNEKRLELRIIKAADLLQSRMGLISDVIYKVESIRGSLAEALHNVDSCFPHLSVIAHAFSQKNCRILYIPRHQVFSEEITTSVECITDYSKARSGIVLTGKYLNKSERRRFTSIYVRYAELSKLTLFGPTGSLALVARELTRLNPLALPSLVVMFLIRKVLHHVRKVNK